MEKDRKTSEHKKEKPDETSGSDSAGFNALDKLIWHRHSVC